MAVAVVAVVGVPAAHATLRFAPSDFDGTGRSDIALFRPSTGTWYVRGSSPIRWGQNGDIPAPGDHGDGRAKIAVFRPSTGTWWVRGSSPIRRGQNGDIPVQAHYRGLAEPTVVAVWWPSTGGWWFDDYRLGQGNPLRYGVRRRREQPHLPDRPGHRPPTVTTKGQRTTRVHAR